MSVARTLNLRVHSCFAVVRSSSVFSSRLLILVLALPMTVWLQACAKGDEARRYQVAKIVVDIPEELDNVVSSSEVRSVLNASLQREGASFRWVHVPDDTNRDFNTLQVNLQMGPVNQAQGVYLLRTSVGATKRVRADLGPIKVYSSKIFEATRRVGSLSKDERMARDLEELRQKALGEIKVVAERLQALGSISQGSTIDCSTLKSEAMSSSAIFAWLQVIRDKRLEQCREFVSHALEQGDDDSMRRVVAEAVFALRFKEGLAKVIDWTQGANGLSLLRVIELAKEVGGDEARAWLFTLSSGHPVQEVRDRAAEASLFLEAKKNKS